MRMRLQRQQQSSESLIRRPASNETVKNCAVTKRSVETRNGCFACLEHYLLLLITEQDIRPALGGPLPSSGLTRLLINIWHFSFFIDFSLSALYVSIKEKLCAEGRHITEILDAVKIIVNQFKKALCSYLAVGPARPYNWFIHSLVPPDIDHTAQSPAAVCRIVWLHWLHVLALRNIGISLILLTVSNLGWISVGECRALQPDDGWRDGSLTSGSGSSCLLQIGCKICKM